MQDTNLALCIYDKDYKKIKLRFYINRSVKVAETKGGGGISPITW